MPFLQFGKYMAIVKEKMKQGDTLTAFLHPQICFRKYYILMQVEDSETGGLKTKRVPTPPKSPWGCTSQFEDHWCQFLCHRIEFDERQVSLGLVSVGTLYTGVYTLAV